MEESESGIKKKAETETRKELGLQMDQGSSDQEYSKDDYFSNDKECEAVAMNFQLQDDDNYKNEFEDGK